MKVQNGKGYFIHYEQDAIDILTTISFLHKQLDECFVVPQHII